jgi:hypothetical protein
MLLLLAPIEHAGRHDSNSLKVVYKAAVAATLTIAVNLRRHAKLIEFM